VRVLVTGARGQLGRDLVDACERAGDDVIATDRSILDITDRPQQPVRLIRVDLALREKPQDLLPFL